MKRIPGVLIEIDGVISAPEKSNANLLSRILIQKDNDFEQRLLEARDKFCGLSIRALGLMLNYEEFLTEDLNKFAELRTVYTSDVLPFLKELINFVDDLESLHKAIFEEINKLSTKELPSKRVLQEKLGQFTDQQSVAEIIKDAQNRDLRSVIEMLKNCRESLNSFIYIESEIYGVDLNSTLNAHLDFTFQKITLAKNGPRDLIDSGILAQQLSAIYNLLTSVRTSAILERLDTLILDDSLFDSLKRQKIENTEFGQTIEEIYINNAHYLEVSIKKDHEINFNLSIGAFNISKYLDSTFSKTLLNVINQLGKISNIKTSVEIEQTRIQVNLKFADNVNDDPNSFTAAIEKFYYSGNSSALVLQQSRQIPKSARFHLGNDNVGDETISLLTYNETSSDFEDQDDVGEVENLDPDSELGDSEQFQGYLGINSRDIDVRLVRKTASGNYNIILPEDVFSSRESIKAFQQVLLNSDRYFELMPEFDIMQIRFPLQNSNIYSNNPNMVILRQNLVPESRAEQMRGFKYQDLIFTNSVAFRFSALENILNQSRMSGLLRNSSLNYDQLDQIIDKWRKKQNGVDDMLIIERNDFDDPRLVEQLEILGKKAKLNSMPFATQTLIKNLSHFKENDILLVDLYKILNQTLDQINISCSVPSIDLMISPAAPRKFGSRETQQTYLHFDIYDQQTNIHTRGRLDLMSKKFEVKHFENNIMQEFTKRMLQLLSSMNLINGSVDFDFSTYVENLKNSKIKIGSATLFVSLFNSICDIKFTAERHIKNFIFDNKDVIIADGEDGEIILSYWD